MEVDNETQSVVDYAIADQEFMALIPAVYQGALHTYAAGAQSGTYTTSCDSLVFVNGKQDSAVYVFNPSGQTCSLAMPDGKIRTGKVSVRLNGKIKSTGSKITLKLIEYAADGISYSCDSIVLITKESTATYATFGVKLVNGSCKTGDYTIKYKFDRTFLVYPQGDNNSESVAYIYGEASGTNRQGTNFSTQILQDKPLVKHKTCRYIGRGIMELTPEGFKTRTINFGEGACDDEATFTVKENTVAFKLK